MEGRGRPSERHEKENCDGVEAFLEEPTGENSNHESAMRGLCEFHYLLFIFRGPHDPHQAPALHKPALPIQHFLPHFTRLFIKFPNANHDPISHPRPSRLIVCIHVHASWIPPFQMCLFPACYLCVHAKQPY